MNSTLRFNADTMTCGGCVRTIRTALEEVPGVTPVHIVPGQPVEVSYDDEATDPAAIVAAVERAGYPTSPVAA
ncbi:MAG: heavy-metal-associated domain-containing protein [Bacteroidota bacterium]